MINVTLDTNCIVALDEDEEATRDIRALIHMHENKEINLRVVAISASERRAGVRCASNFAEFKERIDFLGLAHVEILKPICRLGMSFLDWFVLADDKMVDLEQRIHQILFPEIEFNYREFCEKRSPEPNGDEIDRRWLNARCDVLALWSHIHYGGGIFVTIGDNFHKKTKKLRLINLGVGDILTPSEAVARLSSSANPA